LCLTVSNVCYPGLPGCKSYSASGYSLTLTVGISVTAECSGQNLESDFCREYCLGCNRQDCPCYVDMLNYCLPTSGPQPIGTSQLCQNFFSNYIQNINPTADIDSRLTRYCTTKYGGFGDLFNSNNQTDIELCACHMSQEQYDNFQAQLIQQFPGFGNLGLNERCLLPRCASTSFKTVSTGTQCNLPKCLNIVGLTNNGTFTQSPVIIDQTGECGNIIGEGPGAQKYACNNGQCVADPNGQYATMADCQAACQGPPPGTKYNCQDGQCV
jgi:hypothetical protein